MALEKVNGVFKLRLRDAVYRNSELVHAERVLGDLLVEVVHRGVDLTLQLVYLLLLFILFIGGSLVDIGLEAGRVLETHHFEVTVAGGHTLLRLLEVALLLI